MPFTALTSVDDSRYFAGLSSLQTLSPQSILGGLLSLPVIQAIIETIAKGRQESAPGAGDAIVGRPSKANHLLRYFRVLFGWGMRHGHCKTNPAEGAK